MIVTFISRLRALMASPVIGLNNFEKVNLFIYFHLKFLDRNYKNI